MARTPTEPTPAEPSTNGAPADDHGSGVRARRGDHPRLVDEHYAYGPHGEEELEATDELGRRWYHLRPQPRARYDLIGFNWTWWLIWVFVIFVIFLPWGRGWGY